MTYFLEGIHQKFSELELFVVDMVDEVNSWYVSLSSAAKSDMIVETQWLLPQCRLLVCDICAFKYVQIDSGFRQRSFYPAGQTSTQVAIYLVRAVEAYR